jgi:hypothetical protein
MRLLPTLMLIALLADPNATLTGRMTTTAGAPLQGVEVVAINVETDARFSGKTNDEGFYRLTNIPPGTYRLLFRRAGFQTMLKSGIELRVQDSKALNFPMFVGSESESVTMMEGAPLLQAETATLGQTVDRVVIAEAPTLTRNPYDFIGLTAGAIPALNSAGRGVGFAINGQRAESAAFLLDGSADNTNLNQKNPAQTLPKESVREYRVLTNGFTAEYGRTAGFIANLVTRSGVNQFHGSLYDYSRNSALAANSFENNATGKERNFFNSHQFGGSLGGPIIQDKAFFFGSFESTVARSTETQAAYVPTPELVAISSPATQAIFQRYPLPANRSATNFLTRTVTPFSGGPPVVLRAFSVASRSGPSDTNGGEPQNAYLGTVRGDYKGGSAALTGRYAFEDVSRLAPVRQVYTPDLDQPALTHNHSVTVNLTRAWSSSVVSESRVGFSRLSLTRPEAGPLGLFQEFGIAGEPVRLPTGRQSEGGPRNAYQVHQIASWIHRNHHFKFGGELIHYRDSIDLAFPGVWPQFSSVQGFVDGVLSSATYWTDFLAEDFASGGTVPTSPAPPNRRWNLRYTDTALFGQDTWKLNSRLTLTAGLRWEYFGVQSSEHNEKARDVNFYLGEGAAYYEQFANGDFLRTVDAVGSYRNRFIRPDHNNFAPRLGLAFDLNGRGTTILRASTGIFYDATFARVPPLITRGVSFTNVPFSAAMLDNPYSASGTAAALAPTIDRVDPDRRTSYATAWNVTVDREIRGKFVLSAAYVGSKGSKLELSVIENGNGSGRFVGRPTERLLNEYSLFYTVKSLADSSYHSLQIKAEGRQIRRLGLQFGTSYTWSHSIDNSSARRTEGEGFAQGILLDPSNLHLDRASSSFDVRHRLVTHFIWEPPNVWNRSQVGRHITGGWQISGILSFQTGQPFQVIDGGVPDVVGSARPRVTGPLPQVLGESDMIPDPFVSNRFLYLRANQIRTPVLGSCIPIAAPFACLGSIYDPLDNLLPRNYYRRPGSHFQDLAVTRTMRVRNQINLQVRAEFYNVLNHANLELVPGELGGYRLNQPVFAGGTITGVIARYGGQPRQVVLAARLLF